MNTHQSDHDQRNDAFVKALQAAIAARQSAVVTFTAIPVGGNSAPAASKTIANKGAR